MVLFSFPEPIVSLRPSVKPGSLRTYTDFRGLFPLNCNTVAPPFRFREAQISIGKYEKTWSLALTVLLSACSSTVNTPADLVSKQFPTVTGQSLTKEVVTIPDAYRGKKTVLLIGYQQKTQFDIDRWILGLLQSEVPVQIVEVPTIAGMMPQMVQGFIDNGMRSGIPKEDWGSVVTVYEDAEKIINAIGNDRPQSTHVVLLNESGRILWSSNRGYSAQQVLELKSVVVSPPSM